MKRLGIMLVVACAFSSARAERFPYYGGTLKGSLPGMPSVLDPANASETEELMLIGMVYDTLYKTEASTGTTTPWLAAAMPTYSNNNKTVTILLRQGVQWHDGSELTPTQVLGALTRLRRGHNRWLVSFVASVSADDENHTLTLQLKRRAPELVQRLSAPETAISPRQTRLDAINGTGPFRIKSYDAKKRQLLLAPHRFHFAGRPYLNRVFLQTFPTSREEAAAYEVGQLHYSQNGHVAFSGRTPKYKTTTRDGWHERVFLAPCRGSIWERHKDARVGLSMAINRRALVSRGIPGKVIPQGGDRRPSQARRRVRPFIGRLLAAGTPEILVNDTHPHAKNIAPIIQNDMLNIGLPSRIAVVSPDEYRKRAAAGKCQLRLATQLEQVHQPGHAYLRMFAINPTSAVLRQLARKRISPYTLRRKFVRLKPVITLYKRQVELHHRMSLHWPDDQLLPLGDAYLTAEK